MNATLTPIDLVGGPMCGSLTYIDEDNTDEFHEVPYYGGIAIYRMVENGKARYVEG